MCSLFLFSANMYIKNTEMVKGYFEGLGFASWIVIPLAIVNIAGVIVFLIDAGKILKEWAYADFTLMWCSLPLLT